MYMIGRERGPNVLARILCITALLMTVGCTYFEGGYKTRVGLTNPDNPIIHPNVVDETYGGGTVGQREIEEYDKKYHDKNIFERSQPQVVEEEKPQGE
jgi:hypothetical protein